MSNDYMLVSGNGVNLAHGKRVTATMLYVGNEAQRMEYEYDWEEEVNIGFARYSWFVYDDLLRDLHLAGLEAVPDLGDMNTPEHNFPWQAPPCEMVDAVQRKLGDAKFKELEVYMRSVRRQKWQALQALGAGSDPIWCHLEHIDEVIGLCAEPTLSDLPLHYRRRLPAPGAVISTSLVTSPEALSDVPLSKYLTFIGALELFPEVDYISNSSIKFIPKEPTLASCMATVEGFRRIMGHQDFTGIQVKFEEA